MSLPLSRAMYRCLSDVYRTGDFQHSCKGRSEYGGRFQVARALHRRGLLKHLGNLKYDTTKEGEAALAAQGLLLNEAYPLHLITSKIEAL